MVEKIDPQTTYDAFLGSGALSHPWYAYWKETGVDAAGDVLPGETWSLAFLDVERDERRYEITHDTILQAIRDMAALYVSAVWLTAGECDRRGASLGALRDCVQFIADPDAADFDAGTADEVMQWAAFGTVVYN